MHLEHSHTRCQRFNGRFLSLSSTPVIFKEIFREQYFSQAHCRCRTQSVETLNASCYNSYTLRLDLKRERKRDIGEREIEVTFYEMFLNL